jgi:hypothetical protein
MGGGLRLSGGFSRALANCDAENIIGKPDCKPPQPDPYLREMQSPAVPLLTEHPHHSLKSPLC